MTLIDIVKEIRTKKRAVSDEKELDGWNAYVICKMLSMDAAHIDTINTLQAVTAKLSPLQGYALLCKALPKMGYSPYLKSKSKVKLTDKDLLVIDLLILHFSISKSKAFSYIELMSEEQKNELLLDYGKEV